MKRVALFAAVLGFLALTFIVVHQDFRAIAVVLSRGGWALLLLVPIHAIPLWPDVLAWKLLILDKSNVIRLFWIATVRQAVNRLLPVASVGGEFVGIRLLRRTGVTGRKAVGSVVVEVVVSLVAEYCFVMLGIVCLLRNTGVVQEVHAFILGMLLSLPVIALLALVVRHGSVFERVHTLALRISRKLSRGNPAEDFDVSGSAGVDASIRSICSSNGRLARALWWQFVNRVLGSLETWAALHLLGADVDFSQAIVLESLTAAANHVMFMVPAGLGVQEISFIALGQLLGVGSDIAVAASLAKRMTEIAFGIPALLSWQWAEGRRYWFSTTNRKMP